MKKIVIVIKKLGLGGTEKALISMLEKIPEHKYEITILAMERSGELENYIPKWINIEYIKDWGIGNKNRLLKNIKNIKFSKCISIINSSILVKKQQYHNQYYYICNMLEESENYYDLAISYFMPGELADWYVIKNIKAKKKVVWVHSDVERLFNGVNKELLNKNYLKYDKIFCVCKDVQSKFMGIFPDTSDKVDVFYNIINRKEIVLKANNEKSFNDEFTGIKILTVGRLSREKGQGMIPEILNNLILEGLDIKWYCIGSGDLKDELENKIKKYGLEDRLILLGSKKNPYPYMRDCDIYVQPSEYEGYCTTVEEARCFNKPIIMTNCTGANEQVENETTGFVTQFSVEDILEKVKILAKDKELRDYFSNRSKEFMIDTSKEIDKIEYLLNMEIL